MVGVRPRPIPTVVLVFAFTVLLGWQQVGYCTGAYFKLKDNVSIQPNTTYNFDDIFQLELGQFVNFQWAIIKDGCNTVAQLPDPESEKHRVTSGDITIIGSDTHCDPFFDRGDGGQHYLTFHATGYANQFSSANTIHDMTIEIGPNPGSASFSFHWAAQTLEQAQNYDFAHGWPFESSWLNFGREQSFTIDFRAIEVLDPLCSNSEPEVCDGRQLIPDAGTDSTTPAPTLPRADPEALVTASLADRTGIVADGVSVLLLKLRSDVAVTFTLSSTTSAFNRGELVALDAKASGILLTVQPVPTSSGNFVLAYYRAPTDWPPGDSAGPFAVRIEAFNSNGERKSVDLKVYRPPVILTHGVWSSPSAWQAAEQERECRGPNDFDCVHDTGRANFVQRLTDAGFRVFLTDHSFRSDSASTFNPNAPGVPPNSINALYVAVLEAKKALRDEKIAVSQVDAVGHSMGGLITRAYVRWAHRPYIRSANYNAGDFHKIITIGTPHHGTALVDRLIENRCDSLALRYVCSAVRPVSRFANFVCNAAGRETLEGFFKSIQKPLGPALYEFQTTSIKRGGIGETPVPAHAITTDAPALTDMETFFNALLFQIAASPATVSGNLGNSHDTIVPTRSQQGGLTNSTTEVQSVLHAAFVAGIGQTQSPQVYEKLRGLLKEPLASGNFSEFPTPEVRAGPLPPSDCIAPQSLGAATTASVEAPVPSVSLSTGAITPGGTTTLSFSLSGMQSGHLVVDKVIYPFSGPGPFEIEVAARQEHVANGIRVVAMGVPASGEAVIAELVIPVLSSVTPVLPAIMNLLLN